MALNRYVGYSQKELEAKLRAANDALERGSQTSAGIQAGVRHDFAGKTDAELRVVVRELLQALHDLDPEKYPEDPRTARRMTVRSEYSETY